jgi:hypothetical protein
MMRNIRRGYQKLLSLSFLDFMYILLGFVIFLLFLSLTIIRLQIEELTRRAQMCDYALEAEIRQQEEHILQAQRDEAALRAEQYQAEIALERALKIEFWHQTCGKPDASMICGKLLSLLDGVPELPNLYGNAELLDRCEQTEIEFIFSIEHTSILSLARTGDILSFELAPERLEHKDLCIAEVVSISIAQSE